ncbi:T5orf172 domain-containing protein [Aspergillus alliaceus]|uniref:T5orf172 domain-containing protein n=1 Tax=Petromyces alliaceus TaxID=209559 RepID=A0A5N7CHU5_PETAA|nr:T5orf172 domain-containing protein [Aspergillus alliaceus]
MSVQQFVHFDLTALKALEVSRKCVAQVSEKGSIRRCKKPIGKDRFKAIVAFYEDHHGTSPSGLPLSKLAELCSCHNHRTVDCILDAVEQWTREIGDTDCLPSKALPDSNAPLTPQKTKDDRRRSSLSPDSFEANTQHDSREKVDAKIIELLNMPKKTDTEWHVVYIFSHVKIPNKFKVGHTTKMEDRLEVWAKCYPDLIVKGFTTCTDAKKVEKLVHAELDQRRQKHQCENCKSKPVSHGEWFEKSLSDICRIVKGWAKFVDNAYLENGHVKPEYKSPFTGFSHDDERWQDWIQEELRRNMIPSTPAPELAENTTKTTSSESLATESTTGTDCFESSEALSSPMLPITCSFPRVEENVSHLSSAAEKVLPLQPYASREEKVTALDIGKSIISMLSGISS